MYNKNDACYGTCPHCGSIGWHKYKKKALIFDEPEKYKVSLFKCGNCGKKFGFDLREDKKEEEDDDWEKVFGLLYGIRDINISYDTANRIDSAIQICRKHCRSDS